MRGAGRGWEPALKAQEVAPRRRGPGLRGKLPNGPRGIRQVLTLSCCLGDLSPQQPLDSVLDGGGRGLHSRTLAPFRVLLSSVISWINKPVLQECRISLRAQGSHCCETESHPVSPPPHTHTPAPGYSDWIGKTLKHHPHPHHRMPPSNPQNSLAKIKAASQALPGDLRTWLAYHSGLTPTRMDKARLKR